MNNIGKTINCKQCSKEFVARTWNQTFCNLDCWKKFYQKNFIKKKNQADEIRKKKKSCELCGYRKWLPCLEWHHIEPKDKKFSINYISKQRSPDEVDAEIAKCVVLCCNCHTEIHRGCIETKEKLDRLLSKAIIDGESA